MQNDKLCNLPWCKIASGRKFQLKPSSFYCGITASSIECHIDNSFVRKGKLFSWPTIIFMIHVTDPDMNKWTSSDSKLLSSRFSMKNMLKWLTAEAASGYTPIKLWRFKRSRDAKQRVFFSFSFFCRFKIINWIKLFSDLKCFNVRHDRGTRKIELLTATPV